jgi:flotillin
MAKSDLESIMQERSIYGEQFTNDVRDELAQWGVLPVKNIELMDIKDAKDSNVIQDIMAKKKSTNPAASSGVWLFS